MMAERLDSYDWAQQRPSELDKYLDGSIWRLTKQDAAELAEKSNRQHYTNMQALMLAFANRARAQDKYFRVRREDDDTMVIEAKEKHDRMEPTTGS